jgi:hypothetical protein
MERFLTGFFVAVLTLDVTIRLFSSRVLWEKVHMRNIISAVAVLAVLCLAMKLQAAPIMAGDIVVVRAGDGATTPSGSASAIALLDYSVTYTAGVPTAVTLQQTLGPFNTVGTPGGGAQLALTQGGTAAGEGGLTRSLDSQYMAVAGYNSAPGGLTNGTGNTEARSVGLLNLSTGVVDTSPSYATGGSESPTNGANRNAYTTNGTNIWCANSTGGIRYLTATGTTSTALTTTANERRVYVYNNGAGDQLYTSRMSAGIDGVATVGTPPPPTSGTQTVTLLPGMPTATNSIYDYFFADANTLYVVDDRATASGGLEKWTFNGSTWTMVYNKAANGGTTGLKSLAGMVDASGNVVLFASQVGTGANNLFGYTDTLSNTLAASVTENLLTSTAAFGGIAADWNLRGVAIAPVPEPAALSIFAIGAAALVARRRNA